MWLWTVLRVVTEKMESCEKIIISITYTGDLKSDSGSWEDSEHRLIRGFLGRGAGGGSPGKRTL